MRTFAIMRRVLKEMMRDKRSLALMFLAPILVLWLMSVIFTANSTTSVKIGTVGVTTSVSTNLDQVKHISVHHYVSQKKAKQALKADKIDSIIHKTGDDYSLTYANTDSSKTSATRMAFKTALTQANINQMKLQLGVAHQTIGKLQKNAASTRPKTAAKPNAETEKGNCSADYQPLCLRRFQYRFL
nr:ABC transporter permease [Secundilactobacillus silagei]